MSRDAAGVQVAPVESRKDRRAWLRLPRRLYVGNPSWVPVPDLVVGQILGPKSNPLFRRAALQTFLARRGGEVVGRIAAVDDPRHREIHGEDLAFFGFPEAADQEAFVALMRAAEDWAAGRGRKGMRGPFYPTMLDGCGFLADAYDLPPKISMPYTPPEYLEYAEAAGYRGVKDVWAWKIELAPGETRMGRLAARVRKRLPNMEVLPLDVGKMKKEMQSLRVIFNEAWKDNWGFVPLDDDDFHFLLESSKPILFHPGNSLIKLDGEVAAGAVGLWDANTLFKAMDGKLLPFGWIKMIRPQRHKPGIRTALLGVKPEYRNKGLDLVMIDQLMQGALASGHRDNIECSWVLADNIAMNKSMAAAGCEHYKTYRIVERSF